MNTVTRKHTFDARAYHIEYGRHSNIPDCCIRFFVSEFPEIFRDPVRLMEHNALQMTAERRLGRRFCYRPCLDCMERGHWHRLHRCSGPCADLSKTLVEKHSH